MLKRESFFDLYTEYLSDMICVTPGSAKSYVSYVKGVARHLSADGLLDQICATYGTSAAIIAAEAIGAKVTAEIDDGGIHTTVSIKTLRNYKSGVAMLIPFLENALPGTTINPATLLGASHLSYSRSDLKRIFKSRLSTQDRNHADSSYPARLITKINNRARKLYDRLIDNVKFLCSGDAKKKVKLKDISSVVIANGFAYATVGNVALPIYTETFRDGNSQGYRHADVTSIALLSLDHDIPMKSALTDALKSRSEFKKLSEAFNSYHKAHVGDVASKVASTFFENEYKSGAYNEDTLLDEIQSFINTIHLTVMHKSDNSSKNSLD